VKWLKFSLVTSRIYATALQKLEGKENLQNIFDENIEFLKSIIDLFSNIQIGQEEKFKPVQCGIIITTASFIELANYLISERRYVLGDSLKIILKIYFQTYKKNFLYPTHYNSNKVSLKVLSISQYLQVVKNSNYK